MTLPAELKRLIEEQESLEAKRTHILLCLEGNGKSRELEDQALMFLQMVLATQMHIAKQLLEECSNITCEFVEWPHEIRA